MLTGLSSFVSKCTRVWKLLRKPSRDEFKTVSKISAIGLALIGVTGFIVGVVMTILQTALNLK